MATIKLKVNISGTRDGVEWPRAGKTVDLPEAEAEHLVAAGLAWAVPVLETATADTSKVETRRRG